MKPATRKDFPIHAGQRLDIPSNGKWCASSSFHGLIISILNSFLGIQVKLANGFAKVIATPNGMLIDLTTIQASSSSSRGLLCILLGEYSVAAAPFSAGETVWITNGINAGTYTSLVDGNADVPYNSVNWKKWPAAPQTSNFQ